MKKKLGIFLGLGLLILVLIGLNAATYVQQDQKPDSELSPNRSTYNNGATGTSAFYSLLLETGRSVTRWELSFDDLRREKHSSITAMVIVGSIRRPISDEEVQSILQWVRNGGRLIVIDRDPDERILDALKEWKVKVDVDYDGFSLGLDAFDQKQMTWEMPASKPAQPTLYTTRINAVQTSRFASNIKFERDPDHVPTVYGQGSGYGTSNLQANSEPYDFYKGTPTPTRSPVTNDDDEDYYDADEPAPPPPAPAKTITSGSNTGSGSGTGSGTGSYPPPDMTTYNAPVVHLRGKDRNILIDAKYGVGSIVILSDPYVISNVGVNIADNAQLGVNIVAAPGGLVAFDEYHQGHGAGQNRVLQYFSGTPLIAIVVQLVGLVLLILFSQSRRFARAVPEPEPDRLSKLEYVSAMAELQQRTRAFDLALENIYIDFRRRVCRHLGLDNNLTGRKELARVISERTDGNASEIEQLMFAIEDAIHGEPIGKKASVNLVSSLREIESQLGMVRTRRQRFI